MILPDHLAPTQQQKEQMQRTAMILHHRAEFAAKIYAELIARDYAKAKSDTELLRFDDNGSVAFGLDFELPSKVAVDAATALLFRLNMISAEEFEASKAERVNGSP